MAPVHAKRFWTAGLAVLGVAASGAVRADAVTDWNEIAGALMVEEKLLAPPANRAMAIMHTAVYEAVNAVTQRHPAHSLSLDASRDASIPAAVAAASHATLAKFLPVRAAALEQAYADALAKIPEGDAKSAGIALGARAAAGILEQRAKDGFDGVDAYQPHTAPGVYVPTTLPAVPQWPRRTPWLMTSAAALRPGPPPALDSAQWARDYNEVHALGGRTGSQRSDAQTAQAKFWEATLPSIYHGVVRSVAKAPGRDVTDNARLLMAVTQATDDALIAVFDAKYHYNFWRPITAIRNGDRDGNDATPRDANWVPFIDTPMHPEYPCAHCGVSGAVATVLKAELGDTTPPRFETTSYTAGNIARQWDTLDAFMREVAEARILDGVHFRTSTEAGTQLGI